VRNLPPGLQEHLDTGVTTLCYCWRMTRSDGTVLGFTDHDRDLAFDGTLFAATEGFEKTEMVSSVGYGVDNLDVAGVLNSTRLDDDELSAGLFDNAAIELFCVNWQSVDQRILIRKGNLGEITRQGQEFKAEIRGLAHHLNQPRGRLFQYGCDADFGDTRCGRDLNDPAYKGSGAVISCLDRRIVRASGLEGFTPDWFTRGAIHWTGGANLGARMEVKAHRMLGGVATLELWQPMHGNVAAGDTFSVHAGCDKLFSTCRDKFANQLNFRGFPHMPGNDFVMSYPTRGDGTNTGESQV